MLIRVCHQERELLAYLSEGRHGGAVGPWKCIIGCGPCIVWCTWGHGLSGRLSIWGFMEWGLSIGDLWTWFEDMGDYEIHGIYSIMVCEDFKSSYVMVRPFSMSIVWSHPFPFFIHSNSLTCFRNNDIVVLSPQNPSVRPYSISRISLYYLSPTYIVSIQQHFLMPSVCLRLPHAPSITQTANPYPN